MHENERERKRETESERVRERGSERARGREGERARERKQGVTAKEEKSESFIAVIHGDLPPTANLSHWCKRTGV